MCACTRKREIEGQCDAGRQPSCRATLCALYAHLSSELKLEKACLSKGRAGRTGRTRAVDKTIDSVRLSLQRVRGIERGLHVVGGEGSEGESD